MAALTSYSVRLGFLEASRGATFSRELAEKAATAPAGLPPPCESVARSHAPSRFPKNVSRYLLLWFARLCCTSLPLASCSITPCLMMSETLSRSASAPAQCPYGAAGPHGTSQVSIAPRTVSKTQQAAREISSLEVLAAAARCV